jgi:hypothetical protein
LGWQRLGAFADVVVVLLRQQIVASMRPIAFAAAQVNLALRDSSVSPMPTVRASGAGRSAADSPERDVKTSLNSSSPAA